MDLKDGFKPCVYLGTRAAMYLKDGFKLCVI